MELDEIIGLIDNIISSKCNPVAFKGLVKFIEKHNPTLTNIAKGIAYITKCDLCCLDVLISLIGEYVPDFMTSFPDEITNEYQTDKRKCIILISAYLANYKNSFEISCGNVALDVDEYLYHNLNEMRVHHNYVHVPLKPHAERLRKWYMLRYCEAGFILWEDPIVNNNDILVA